MDELPSSDKVLVRLKCVWKKAVALETAFMKAIESKKSVDEKMEVKSNCGSVFTFPEMKVSLIMHDLASCSMRCAGTGSGWLTN